MAKVSVLIPVYNVEKYLEECLESVIRQTLKDIEIICVNDGSTDGSAKILEKYARKDKRIKVITKENGGLPSARNAGIDAATGEYLSFVDSDDYVQPEMMKTLYKNARKHNAEIVICGANVFPEEPRADGWVYSVLSPRKAFYAKGDEKLIFEEPASRPFVWRTFVKKELIDRNNFRLDETIHIGEDNAFQFRIYPKANGILTIPDKLYNYRWFRKDSLMNTIVYKDQTAKTVSHIKMVIHVTEEWIKSGDAEKMGADFFKWSVEFLYDDFIKLPQALKAEWGKKLCSVWDKGNYYRFKPDYPDYINDMFKYFNASAEEEAIDCSISVVMSVDKDYPYLEKTLKNILGQSLKNIELIILNSGASDTAYAVLHKYIHKDKRVRLYNIAGYHFTEDYNRALRICTGKYVQFIKPTDCYADKKSLENLANFALKSDNDIIVSLHRESLNASYSGSRIMLSGDKIPENYYLEASLENLFFKNELLKNAEELFENYSLESGNVFLAKMCLEAENIGLYNNVVCVTGIVYKPDWIPTAECERVLCSFAERLRLSEEYGNKALHRKIYSLLCSDYYTKILVNNTLPYWMPEFERPNGENSQYEIIEQIDDILSLLDPDMLETDDNDDNYDEPLTLPPLLLDLINRRQDFIANISEEYKNI